MKLFLLHFLILSSVLCSAQSTKKLMYSNEDVHLVKKSIQSKFKDSLELVKYIKNIRLLAIKRGFLLASNDSVLYRKDEVEVKFFLGPKFKNAKLHFAEEDLQFLKAKSSISEKLIRNVDFSAKEVQKILKLVFSTFENNGYPFCSVKLDEITFEGDNLNANVVVNRNTEFRFSKINLVGDPVVSSKLISSYIQIKVGDIYSQQKVNEISGKLKLISFIREVKPAELLFTPEGVELFLYLNSRPVSLANGVVGLQPDPIKSKVNLTGELRLKLVNTLKKAEMFELNWRSIQAQTSSLKINTIFPNLFQSSFGLDGQFQLYKRDSTFLEIKSTIGVQYALKQGNFLKIFYRRASSDILGGGTNSTIFTNLKSVETNYYGLAFSKQSLDYLPNPSRGILLHIEGTIGSRKTKDTLAPIIQTTYRFELNIQWFLPLAKRHILKLTNYSESYFAPTYYQNEVFRFGGQISLRGFNEEEIYATSRSVSTVEYRFLLDQNSFLFAFFDQGWYENKATKFLTDTPFGFGAGFAFGTSIGNFSVSYALGSQRGNPILVKDGKIHFGYIAYF